MTQVQKTDTRSTTALRLLDFKSKYLKVLSLGPNFFITNLSTLERFFVEGQQEVERVNRNGRTFDRASERGEHEFQRTFRKKKAR